MGLFHGILRPCILCEVCQPHKAHIGSERADTEAKGVKFGQVLCPHNQIDIDSEHKSSKGADGASPKVTRVAFNRVEYCTILVAEESNEEDDCSMDEAP